MVGVVIRSVKRYDLVKIKPTVRSRKQNTDFAYGSVAYDQVKTALSESQAEAESKPMTMFDSGPCNWLGLPLLLPTRTTQFSRNRKRNRKKWKRSDSEVLILPTPIPSSL